MNCTTRLKRRPKAMSAPGAGNGIETLSVGWGIIQSLGRVRIPTRYGAGKSCAAPKAAPSEVRGRPRNEPAGFSG